ncbi:MAG: NADPH:quinone reductase-like Zn-dependent oxidoreductase [Glaciecola sp.]|jgi:NADPH:quinone reductase-like Zn-dependent oxidoreductase
MRAAIITQYGNPAEVADVERPSLPADSVMIEVHASSINPIDWIIMAGYVKEMFPYEMPWIIGYDVSGVVTEVGPDVTSFTVGDEVFGRAGGMQAGTMAEFAAIKASDLAVKPDNISHAEAAGVPLVGLTAWQALFDKGGLTEGQRVLIHGGSGGVGALAIQIAKHAGAWVATTASAKNKDLVLGLGADQFVDYASEKFEDVVEHVDLVIDVMGDDTLARSFDVVKSGGTVVSVKGEAPEGLAAERNVAFHSFFMEPSGEQLTDLADLIRKEAVRPVLDRSFPLDDVAAAFEYAQSGTGAGKVALTIRD